MTNGEKKVNFSRLIEPRWHGCQCQYQTSGENWEREEEFDEPDSNGSDGDGVIEGGVGWVVNGAFARGLARHD